MTSPLKNRADRIRNRKHGTVANVTNRLNEGDEKGAGIARRKNVAASKGNTARVRKLQKRLDAQDSRFFRSLTPAQKKAANEKARQANADGRPT